MKGRVALVGATGMLGRAMHDALEAQRAEVSVLERDVLDLTRRETIVSALDPTFDWVVNCAAYTDVDGAETAVDVADAINGMGVGHLAVRCRDIDASLITFGTDYVFDGRGTQPYAVDRPLDPQNAYGRSKALGERLLVESGARHLNIRTSWLYAPWGHNFVLTMARLTRERDSLRVVSDQRGAPTSCRHLAATTLRLAEHGAEGTFHVTDGGDCTWHDLARIVADYLGHTCDIAPCTSDEFSRAAARPAYSVLDVSRTEAIVGPMPPHVQSVASALAQSAECAS